ncbi:GNAT family N-acetyltransferase [Paenibacillus sp. 481]|uniref:GNAT family N-acetyltransferase n=1 Tax=Paenibacillus sp. 481 TaxID=2835869 RepID=UPI001E3E304C|nr:GNAT family N-acetyltransferase [Paenibacillus sp. 481]UHA74695.1 GNAT family N-acetyltransferase [Paenibacillus sp. 481]
MEIKYVTNPRLTAEQVLHIYEQSGLRRPTEIHRIQSMLENANVMISAWHEDKLVGFLRAMTDFTFDCYVNDLAVHTEYQKHGIGKELVNRLHEQLEDNVLIFLISTEDAKSFYSNLNFKSDFARFGEPMCKVAGGQSC